MNRSQSTPTFADACESVLSEPEREHSLYTTLAPLYDRLMADLEEHYDDKFRALAPHVPETAETVLEVGCGVGGLLPLLEARFPHVVGLDRRPELLAFAERRARHAALVEGDVTDCDLDERFDVVVAVEYVTAHLLTDDDLAAAFETVHDRLQPEGVFVFDAVVDPVAVEEPGVDVFTGGGYRLERAVDVVPAPDLPGVRVDTDYRVTDVAGDRQATASERLPVRTFTLVELRDALAAAGFGDVAVEHDAADDGAVLVVARR